MVKEYAKKYINELKKSLDSLPLDALEDIIALMKEAYRNGKRIYIAGNGGSAATASHFVCDLVKGTGVRGKNKFKAIGLTDNLPLITAWANDVSYDDVFSAQLAPLIEKGDLLIVFSGSGNSKNIIKAVEFANGAGAKTIALVGFDGGKVKDAATKTLIVPADNMERAEDIHLILEHLIHLYLVDEINFGNMGTP
ncbi:MAG: SIS domain-containing protein [bacterium]